jgi:hypothetical protein
MGQHNLLLIGGSNPITEYKSLVVIISIWVISFKPEGRNPKKSTTPESNENISEQQILQEDLDVLISHARSPQWSTIVGVADVD